VTALDAAIEAIGPLDEAAMRAARARLDGLTKPPGSLGRLEDLAVQLAGITGEAAPSLVPRTVVVVAADHGVAARGVSAYPSEVTAQMVANFVAGGAAVNVLSRLAGAGMLIVDAGVATPIPDVTGNPPGGRLIAAPVRRGTADITSGPAMDRDEALAAIELGAEIARDLVASGTRAIAVGEMGIGNTTAASALTAVLLRLDPAAVTGRGTGIDDAALAAKIDVVRRAIDVNRPDADDPIGALAAVGGLEIATLVGLVLEAAANRTPVILDGFITAAAALIAAALCPALPARLIAAHRSTELGHGAILAHLRLEPLLDLGLRLGEASGAVLALGLLDAACALRDGMATFDSAAVSGPRADLAPAR
jgi:nicotinate-nucleotide--dimethylbenzimidazole phosphoribosyltransferase